MPSPPAARAILLFGCCLLLGGCLVAVSDAFRLPPPQLRARGRQQHRLRMAAAKGADLADDFCLTVLGDLHLDRKDMEPHEEGRQHVMDCMAKVGQTLSPNAQRRLVSLGDLGAYGEAGTTASFELAKEYLDGFNVNYNLVTGNHDLEGMQQFETDLENLMEWQRVFGLTTPYFCHQIGKRTLCVGLSTTHFRSARYSSHEVYIPKAQTMWLEELLQKHPEEEGWRVLVFTHAPPMGAGIRVVQNVHIKNGCAWLNHSSGEEERRVFLRLCKQHHCIKAWFSGHFHLSHDHEDSISSSEGTAFVQTGVMGAKSTRDGRRQSRLVKGDGDGLSVYTINHHKGGELRLDVTITYKPGGEDVVEAHGHEDYDHEKWFSAFTPQPNDGCYIQEPNGVILNGSSGGEKVCWFHLEDKVLGVHEGQIVEYDAETLSPLGIVLDRENLAGREVVVADGEVLMLMRSLDDLNESTAATDYQIVHPNEDGSYWRKFQKNKLIRQQEKEREKMAEAWIKRNFQ